jgi:16S rRNA G966 N2-methylase RsmD
MANSPSPVRPLPAPACSTPSPAPAPSASKPCRAAPRRRSSSRTAARRSPLCARTSPHSLAPAALAFLDPPYGKGLAAPALTALAAAGWLATGALCIVETAAKERIEPPPGFAALDERRYGAARLVFLRYDADQPS